MEELFEIIKAVNRQREILNDLCGKIDALSNTPALQVPPEYLDDAAACRIMHIKSRTLTKLRSKNLIRYYKSGNKFLYLHADIHDYLEKNCVG